MRDEKILEVEPETTVGYLNIAFAGLLKGEPSRGGEGLKPDESFRSEKGRGRPVVQAGFCGMALAANQVGPGEQLLGLLHGNVRRRQNQFRFHDLIV